jgi:hypothetical protein
MPTESPILKKLYLGIQEFREAMKGNAPLTEFDEICLENYIALLQSTYVEWKRRKRLNLQCHCNKRAA